MEVDSWWFSNYIHYKWKLIIGKSCKHGGFPWCSTCHLDMEAKKHGVFKRAGCLRKGNARRGRRSQNGSSSYVQTCQSGQDTWHGEATGIMLCSWNFVGVSTNGSTPKWFVYHLEMDDLGIITPIYGNPHTIILRFSRRTRSCKSEAPLRTDPSHPVCIICVLRTVLPWTTNRRPAAFVCNVFWMPIDVKVVIDAIIPRRSNASARVNKNCSTAWCLVSLVSLVSMSPNIFSRLCVLFLDTGLSKNRIPHSIQ